MTIECPHCQHGQHLALAPGRHVLKCKACRRGFPFVVPQGEEERAQEERTQVDAPERTLIVRAPPEKPRAGALRARTSSPQPVSQAAPEEDGVPTSLVNVHTLRRNEPSSLATLPGDLQEEEEPRAPTQERTQMVRFPETPAAAAPQEEEVTPRPAPAPREEEELPLPRGRPARTPTPRPRAASSPRARTPGPRRALPAQEAAPPPEPPPEPEKDSEEESEEESEPRAHDTLSLAEGMRLGGYQLLRKLGAGAMGTVWLARQLSLDRDVALKILRPSLARDPQFVYRFTQEAFAAAQLVHHNIVQIYDCGSEKQAHFFSMEYVDAESLQSLLDREGRLDPEVAAGYALQAARGLKFAHDRGMVHRDIKPENLLLNHNGIVKVADLGLVKRSARKAAHPAPPPHEGDAEALTNVKRNPRESAMGTPAYMAPEQVENSSRVDGRADIYSLGCTLYHLLTGHPPFEAESAVAVMTMHLLERPVPPEEKVRRVPRTLSELVLRMMARRPEERFQKVDEVIRALESFLGIEGTASFSPREEHANLLERCVQGFNQAPWARRRRWLVLGAGLLAALATGLAGWRWGPLVALAVAAFAAATWMASFTVRGLLQKGALFLRFRQLVFRAPLLTWLVWLLLLGGAGFGLYHFRLLLPAGGLLGGALLCAVGFYLLVDRRVAAERGPFVEEVEQMLRSMRLRGLEEGALRQFVCKYSGESWESFYEALFGYDAKQTARERWGRDDRGLPRKKHGSWREPLIRGMDALERARQRRRERRQMSKLDRERAKAPGGAAQASP